MAHYRFDDRDACEKRLALEEGFKTLVIFAVLLGYCFGGYKLYQQHITKQPQEQKPAVEKPAKQQNTIQPKRSTPLPEQQELRFDSKPENAPQDSKKITSDNSRIFLNQRTRN